MHGLFRLRLDITVLSRKNCPLKIFILGQTFSAIVQKIFVHLAKSYLLDFSSALYKQLAGYPTAVKHVNACVLASYMFEVSFIIHAP